MIKFFQVRKEDEMIRKHRIDVLITRGEIRAYIHDVAEKVDAYYRELGVAKVIMLGALTGAFVFMSELLQQLEDINARFEAGQRIQWLPDFIDMKSRKPDDQGMMSFSGEVLLRRDSTMHLAGEQVLIVEDIADTGHSLDWLMSHVAARGCADLQVSVMLRKPSAAEVEVPIRFVGKDILNEFVVGMGLDWLGLYRGLPYIGKVILEQETASKA